MCERPVLNMELCEHFPEIVQRFEAWWERELVDRPIFLGMANTRLERPINRRLDLLDDPESWFAAKYQDMLQLHRCGDMLPHIRVDFGPVFLASIFSGQRLFGADTGWTPAMINDDWSNIEWAFSKRDPWWQRMAALLVRVSAAAKGQFAVCSPNLGGAGDILLTLRGATELSLDLLDQPEKVQHAIRSIYPAWWQSFRDLYRIPKSKGAELIHWLYLRSSTPYVIAECDFSYMISTKHFEDFFLPDIARQAAEVERSVFHMDGPGCTKHVDAVLSIAELDAIQFTPGVENPSALPWVKMFRKIQAKGKSLLVICPAEEVLTLCDELSPKGLGVLIETPLTSQELDELYEQVSKKFRGRRVYL
jgi:hypothetical protein